MKGIRIMNEDQIKCTINELMDNLKISRGDKISRAFIRATIRRILRQERIRANIVVDRCFDKAISDVQQTFKVLGEIQVES